MSFQPFTRVTGAAAPLLRANVDTDVILRVDRLTTRSPEDLAPFAFEALRHREGGSEEPPFVLDRPPFRGAPILLAGANFGCGSSREPAVWALQGLGIRCVIAPSFGDIFRGNCFQNGVLAVELPPADVAALAAEAEDGAAVTVDLEAQRIVTAGGRAWSFVLDAPRRAALLEGLDDLDMTRRDEAHIAAFQASDRRARPWVWNVEEGETR